jgi:hypothetical protein
MDPAGLPSRTDAKMTGAAFLAILSLIGFWVYAFYLVSCNFKLNSLLSCSSCCTGTASGPPELFLPQFHWHVYFSTKSSESQSSFKFYVLWLCCLRPELPCHAGWPGAVASSCYQLWTRQNWRLSCKVLAGGLVLSAIFNVTTVGFVTTSAAYNAKKWHEGTTFQVTAGRVIRAHTGRHWQLRIDAQVTLNLKSVL